MSSNKADLIALSGECYKRYINGDSLTDDQVEAAAKTALKMAYDLALYGPSFVLAAKEMVGFGHAMQSAWESRQRDRHNRRRPTTIDGKGNEMKIKSSDLRSISEGLEEITTAVNGAFWLREGSLVFDYENVDGGSVRVKATYTRNFSHEWDLEIEEVEGPPEAREAQQGVERARPSGSV